MAVLRLVIWIVVWLAGLAGTRAVVEPSVAETAFPQWALPAVGGVLLGAAGAYGVLAGWWMQWMHGRSLWLRIPVAVVGAALAALALLAGTRQVEASLSAAGTPAPPALLLALFQSSALWLSGLALGLTAATLGARPPERRMRFGVGRVL